ncbi:MAG: response regulator transcription factor [Butyricicoccus pullicaecorum]|nr:response regulator transcription factor [Butyricicoccus pullicaecorum]MDO4668506.1 response regulator transcription factor [Butyricicoccus pullicaecorum]
MHQILLLEDDIALSQGITLALRASGQITACSSLKDARALLRQQSFDLLLLDINLPDGTGIALCREVRQTSSVPILFLTARDTEYDEVAGLESGADDYITKPFRLAVLRARVEAALRRSKQTAPDCLVKIGTLTLDFDQQIFTRSGVPLSLSRTEQRLLRFLIENSGHVLTREFLMDRVWNGGDFVDENTLSVTIRRLRSKLEPDPKNPIYIRTIYGIGYLWEATNA